MSESSAGGRARTDYDRPAQRVQEPGIRCARMSDAVWSALLSKAAGSHADLNASWSAEEQAAWSLYAPLCAGRADGPLLFAQVGQSLDGRIATLEGDAQNVSGDDGLRHLHRCRAMADAVVIGVNTALCDDPRLTVRLVEGESPARIVIDPNGRLPNNARLLAPDGRRSVIIQACDAPRPAHVEVMRISAENSRIDPLAIVLGLAELGFKRLLIEGGGITIGCFLDAGLLDRLHVGISPLIIGAGPNGLSTMPVARLADALRPKTHVYGLGTDVIFDCELGKARTSTCPTTQEPADTTASRR